MRIRPAILAITMLSLGILYGCQAPGVYEGHVRNLRSGTPNHQVKASVRALRAAGVDAFPTLIQHLDDKRRSSPILWGATLSKGTIGEACLDIVRMEIEGVWPKAFREFHVLSQKNAREWLREHSDQSLEQLRCAAQEESLQRAQVQLDILQETVRFIAKPYDERWKSKHEAR